MTTSRTPIRDGCDDEQQPSPSPPSRPPLPSPASSTFDVDWDPGLDSYLEECFGAPRWHRTKASLARPPRSTCLRLADAADADDVVAEVDSGERDDGPFEAFRVSEPAALAALNVVLVRERDEIYRERMERACPSNYSTSPAAAAAVVVVSRVAAEAALRGAPVFSPGVLACTRGVSRGDRVEIRVAIEPRFRGESDDEKEGEGDSDAVDGTNEARRQRKKKLKNAPSSVKLRAGHGIQRGTVFSSPEEAAAAAPLLLGRGRAFMGRKEATSSCGGGGEKGTKRGVAVVLEEPNASFGWRRSPAEADLLGGEGGSGFDESGDGGGGGGNVRRRRRRGMAQHLSSIVAAVALGAFDDPKANVLDMCAAPGGKTTAIAQGLMATLKERTTATTTTRASPPRAGAGAPAAARWSESGNGSDVASPSPSPVRHSLPSVLAIDRTAAKAKQVASLADELGVSSLVTAAAADSMRLFPSPSPSTARGESGEEKRAPPCPGARRSEEARLRKEARKAATRAAMGSGKKEKEKEEKVSTTTETPPPFPLARRSDLAPDPARLVPGSFTHVLLDAPCSGLGLRPRLAQHADRAFVARASAVQRALISIAVAAAGGDENASTPSGDDNFGARTGGARVVYSTCSISPEENEAVVAAALRKWPRLVLEDARAAAPEGVASPGLSGRGPSLASFRGGRGSGEPKEAEFLPPGLAPFVLRFDPSSSSSPSPPSSLAGEDTIGFFVACFSVAAAVPPGGWVARAAADAAASEGGDKSRRALESEPSPPSRPL